MSTLSDPSGPTGRLCQWVADVVLDDIPEDIKTRAKYLMLDGLACALVGAHLPWSTKAAHAITGMETSGGSATVFGWDTKISPVMAALLNSTFIQGFELDDWHDQAPLHSNSIILPALFAAAEHESSSERKTAFSGNDLLLGTIVGYEIGPRIGLALHGADMLTVGWHSGAVFGPSAAAAAVGKLLGLSSSTIEDSLGIACTQACGLMSAQFESDVKRMQHGFAARNGLFAALLARQGYVGIKKVYERPYGGFLSMFGLGSGKTPPYKEDEVCKDLGTVWQTDGVRVKPYAAMALTHPTVDCISALQNQHPDLMKDYKSIAKVQLGLSDAAFNHGGFEIAKPLNATGAQMSNIFVAAVQLVDGQVLPPQFREENLVKSAIWDLVAKIKTVHVPDFATSQQRVTITFDNGQVIKHEVEAARGVKPSLTNAEILQKWRDLTATVINDERRTKIEEIVLNMEECDDVTLLGALLAEATKNPIA